MQTVIIYFRLHESIIYNFSFEDKFAFNPLIAALKPQSNGPSYSNTVIGTLAVDGWAVTFGTARRGLGGPQPAQSPPRCTKCNSPLINGQCTNFVLFDADAFGV